jgi:acetyl esterase/lipase
VSEQPSLHIPAREIPVPRHLSAQAQAFLAVPRPSETVPFPALDDAEGWKKQIAERDQMILQMMRERMPTLPCSVTELHEREALAYDIIPDGVRPDDRRVYLDIHGGALIYGGGEVCKSMAMGTVFRHMVRVVTVDYRIAPDHPHPAALDDCLAFYRALLRDRAPSEIIVGGGSAGANLAAALMLRARDEGLPLPAALVLISPEADLTESGDSFNTNATIDGMGSLMAINLLYANGAALDDPYLSPLFGDFTKGYPPTLITAGTRDLFLSNAARLHRALRNADIPAELHIQEGAVHGAFGGAPEDAEIDREIKLFCAKYWGS